MRDRNTNTNRLAMVIVCYSHMYEYHLCLFFVGLNPYSNSSWDSRNEANQNIASAINDSRGRQYESGGASSLENDGSLWYNEYKEKYKFCTTMTRHNVSWMVQLCSILLLCLKLYFHQAKSLLLSFSIEHILVARHELGSERWEIGCAGRISCPNSLSSSRCLRQYSNSTLKI